MNRQDYRLAYGKAVKAFANAGLDPKKAVLTQSHLRFEVEAATNKTSYEFGILVNDTRSQIFPTETRLELQDMFFVNRLFIFLGKAATQQDISFQLHSYPNTQTFATSYPALQALYNNGRLQIEVNRKQVLVNHPVMKHYYVPQTQQWQNQAAVHDQFSMEEGIGGANIEPHIVLLGTKNNEMKLELKQSLSQVEAGTRIVVIVDGILAQNSTKIS